MFVRMLCDFNEPSHAGLDGATLQVSESLGRDWIERHLAQELTWQQFHGYDPMPRRPAKKTPVHFQQEPEHIIRVVEKFTSPVPVLAPFAAG